MRRLEVIWSASSRQKLPLEIGEAISARLPSGSAAIKPPFDGQQAQPDSFVDRGLDETPPNTGFNELVVRHGEISVLATGVRASSSSMRSSSRTTCIGRARHAGDEISSAECGTQGPTGISVTRREWKLVRLAIEDP
jgi:hypothetical protein